MVHEPARCDQGQNRGQAMEALHREADRQAIARGIAQVERGEIYASADVLRIIQADGAQPVVCD
jgi:hypothetical protein